MSTTKQDRTPGTGIIGPVRLAYLFVHEPRVNNLEPDKEPQFETTLLIPKQASEFNPEPEKTLEKMKRLVQEAYHEFFGNKTPQDPKNPLRDGDLVTNSQGDPKFPGYYFVKTSAQFKPLLIDGFRNAVTDKDTFVSGDWGNVKVSCYGYDRAGNRGVSVGLRGIQFTRKDKPLGSGGTTPEEFDIIETGGGEFDPFAE